MRYPEICQNCENQHHVFRSSGHPDDGVKFACGVMIENMAAGNVLFNCPYFAPRKPVPVIEAGHCCSCPAMRICKAIVNNGTWNPWGSALVKPCPGVLK